MFGEEVNKWGSKGGDRGAYKSLFLSAKRLNSVLCLTMNFPLFHPNPSKMVYNSIVLFRYHNISTDTTFLLFKKKFSFDKLF